MPAAKKGGARSARAKTLPRPSMPPEPAPLAAAALRPLRRLPTVAAGCQREKSAREEPARAELRHAAEAFASAFP
jgi:hypothetical protein